MIRIVEELSLSLCIEIKKIEIMEFDGSKIDYSKISNVVVSGIDFEDYPDFCDAYIVSADYDGEPMTDLEIDELNQDGEFVNESVFKQVF